LHWLAAAGSSVFWKVAIGQSFVADFLVVFTARLAAAFVCIQNDCTEIPTL
jgi:hypothetical protein